MSVIGLTGMHHHPSSTIHTYIRRGGQGKPRKKAAGRVNAANGTRTSTKVDFCHCYSCSCFTLRDYPPTWYLDTYLPPLPLGTLQMVSIKLEECFRYCSSWRGRVPAAWQHHSSASAAPLRASQSSQSDGCGGEYTWVLDFHTFMPQ